MALRELKETVSTLPNEVEATINSHLEYYKLYIFRIIAKTAMGFVSLFVVALLVLIIAFFLAALGFLVVGGLFMLVLWLIYANRKRWINKPILGKLSEIYFKE